MVKWKRERVQDHKFDFINVHDFEKFDALSKLRYSLVFFIVLKSVLVYIADLWTAIALLLLDNWTGSQLKPKIPIEISKWIFIGSIIISYALMLWELKKARPIIISKDISFTITNMVAYRYYTLTSYPHWCLFQAIEDQQKTQDKWAFFVFFTFKGYKRLLLCDGPRQVINAITLYTYLQDNKFDFSWNHYNNVIKMAMGVMTFTVAVFAISAFLLLVAFIIYLPLLCKIRGNLKEYCCHIIDKRISQLLKQQKKKRVIENAQKERKPNPNKAQPTLPMVDGPPPPPPPTAFNAYPETAPTAFNAYPETAPTAFNAYPRASPLAYNIHTETPPAAYNMSLQPNLMGIPKNNPQQGYNNAAAPNQGYYDFASPKPFYYQGTNSAKSLPSNAPIVHPNNNYYNIPRRGSNSSSGPIVANMHGGIHNPIVANTHGVHAGVYNPAYSDRQISPEQNRQSTTSLPLRPIQPQYVQDHNPYRSVSPQHGGGYDNIITMPGPPVTNSPYYENPYHDDITYDEYNPNRGSTQSPVVYGQAYLPDENINELPDEATRTFSSVDSQANFRSTATTLVSSNSLNSNRSNSPPVGRYNQDMKKARGYDNYLEQGGRNQ